MNPELKVIIYEQRNVLNKLLKQLDEQYDLIINKEVIKIDKIVKELDETSKELAKLEINRRKITGSETSMKNIIEKCEDENIKKAYEEITNTLKMIEVQKEANETIIKQKLFFTKKMISFIKPNNGMGTYNAYGQVGK